MGHDGLDNDRPIDDRRGTDQIVVPAGRLLEDPTVPRVLSLDRSGLDQVRNGAQVQPSLGHPLCRMVRQMHGLREPGAMPGAHPAEPTDLPWG
jgi:hypothetical protein